MRKLKWFNKLNLDNSVESRLPQETASRYTLSPDWQAMQPRVDWMHAPYMPEYVNSLVSGRSLNDNGHWAIYAREKYLLPFRKKRRHGLSLVSLASGSGYIEESLLSFGWPITYLLGLEYDEELRREAINRFQKYRKCRAYFDYFDFNKEYANTQQFDIVFTCHSLHHANDLEGLMETINRLLKPDGLVIGIDYFGPTRFQIEYDVLPIISELYQYLPDDLRRDLRFEEEPSGEQFVPPSLYEVRDADISESVRSSDLRTLLFSTFPVIEIKPMGGTILRWLLQYRAGNFDPQNSYHVTIIRLLQFIERELMSSSRIKSDDLFFVLQKSHRVNDYFQK
jgi:SAM-dependent methyltransferase